MAFSTLPTWALFALSASATFIPPWWAPPPPPPPGTPPPSEFAPPPGSLDGPLHGGCPSYTIIDTRGTGELQGPALAFVPMNGKILKFAPGGKVHDTVYLADASQHSEFATLDIINRIRGGLAANPHECFILEGYSEGAAATVNAMRALNGPEFDAVKAVVLMGNPEHRGGLPCNVDAFGGPTTHDSNGLEVGFGGIPDNWVPKTLDVCNFGDGICDPLHGVGVNGRHLAYGGLPSVQKMGTDFVLAHLHA